MHLPSHIDVLADAERQHPDSLVAQGWKAARLLAGYYSVALGRLRDLEERDDRRRVLSVDPDDGPEDDEAAGEETHDMGEPVGRTA